jgi:hypothetical protein
MTCRVGLGRAHADQLVSGSDGSGELETSGSVLVVAGPVGVPVRNEVADLAFAER